MHYLTYYQQEYDAFSSYVRRFTSSHNEDKFHVLLRILTSMDIPEELFDLLRKRNHVLGELGQPRGPRRHKIHLHVLQSHEHRFEHRGARKQLAQVSANITTWKAIQRIHPVQKRTLRNNTLIVTTGRLNLFLNVHITRQASAPMRTRNKQIFVRRAERRQALPP